MNSANHGNGSYSYLFNGTAGSQKVGDRSKTFNTGATVLHFLIVLQIYKEISVAKTPETFRLKSRFKHTANYLKKMGIPANNSIQV